MEQLSAETSLFSLPKDPLFTWFYLVGALFTAYGSTVSKSAIGSVWWPIGGRGRAGEHHRLGVGLEQPAGSAATQVRSRDIPSIPRIVSEHPRRCLRISVARDLVRSSSSWIIICDFLFLCVSVCVSVFGKSESGSLCIRAAPVAASSGSPTATASASPKWAAPASFRARSSTRSSSPICSRCCSAPASGASCVPFLDPSRSSATAHRRCSCRMVRLTAYLVSISNQSLIEKPASNLRLRSPELPFLHWNMFFLRVISFYRQVLVEPAQHSSSSHFRRLMGTEKKKKRHFFVRVLPFSMNLCGNTIIYPFFRLHFPWIYHFRATHTHEHRWLYEYCT